MIMTYVFFLLCIHILIKFFDVLCFFMSFLEYNLYYVKKVDIMWKSWKRCSYSLKLKKVDIMWKTKKN